MTDVHWIVVLVAGLAVFTGGMAAGKVLSPCPVPPPCPEVEDSCWGRGAIYDRNTCWTQGFLLDGGEILTPFPCHVAVRGADGGIE